MINQLKALIVQGFMDVIGLYWALISAPFRIIWNFGRETDPKPSGQGKSTASAR